MQAVLGFGAAASSKAAARVGAGRRASSTKPLYKKGANQAHKLQAGNSASQPRILLDFPEQSASVAHSQHGHQHHLDPNSFKNKPAAACRERCLGMC